MRILADVERTFGALDAAPEIADRLRDRQNVRLGEAAAQRRPPVSAGAETDHLVGIVQVRHTFEILAFQLGHVGQHGCRGRQARKRRDRLLSFHGNRHGSTFHVGYVSGDGATARDFPRARKVQHGLADPSLFLRLDGHNSEWSHFFDLGRFLTAPARGANPRFTPLRAVCATPPGRGPPCRPVAVRRGFAASGRRCDSSDRGGMDRAAEPGRPQQLRIGPDEFRERRRFRRSDR